MAEKKAPEDGTGAGQAAYFSRVTWFLDFREDTESYSLDSYYADNPAIYFFHQHHYGTEEEAREVYEESRRRHPDMTFELRVAPVVLARRG